MSDFVIPKKSLGQHWLHDVPSLTAMADGVMACKGDFVLEVGPGLGTLTEVLLARGAKVTAVEFDHDLAVGLPRRVRHENLQVVEQDILSFDFTKLPSGYKVAANIPYYLTSNLLRVMCESNSPFSQAALLIQKEVAERVCSKPGDMSLLSVSVQFYCEARLGILVPAELFTPPPKVDSQILLLQYRERPLFADVDTKQFFRLVKAGFSQRRKKLRSSLSAGLAISKPDTEALLAKAGLDPNLRAQNLSLEDWHVLYLAHKT
ncbi:MAG: 16S rRNA (adenine(1518)-N(6)/adenine(1519)-N(6))-dimethyltransferase RsmA [Candidatus Saccharimonadales bacterium]